RSRYCATSGCRRSGTRSCQLVSSPPCPSASVTWKLYLPIAVLLSGRCRSCEPADRLQLAVGVERPAPPVAPDAAQLVAPERCVGMGGATIDLHGTGPERPRDAQGARSVPAPDVAVETELRVVGERDGFFLVAEGDRGDHRPEDLLAGDHHVVPRGGEERRLDVVAAGQVRRAPGAAGERRPSGPPPREVARDPPHAARGDARVPPP